MMTERAQQIVDQKPTGWEYKLTAELLEAELPSIRAQFDDLHRGLALAPTKAMGGLEFMGFVRAQIQKLQVMLQQPELILQNELMPAWGPAGFAGDAAAIECAVARFADTCLQLYGWERDRQALIPPADFKHVHESMKGWAEHLFRQVDATILKLCPMLANPPSSGRLVFEMDFKAPANVVEVTRELEELDRKHSVSLSTGATMPYGMIWQKEVRHHGLNKYRLIRGPDKYVVEQKAAAQEATWDAMWQKKLQAQSKEAKKALARERTEEAVKVIDDIGNTLCHAVGKSHKIEWDDMKDRSPFPKYLPDPPPPLRVPPEPTPSHYPPLLGLFDKLITSRKKRKIEESTRAFSEAHAKWDEKVNELTCEANAKVQAHNEAVKRWEEEKAEFLKRQEERNSLIDKRRAAYLQKSPKSIVDYCRTVLSNSKYPDSFPKEFDVDYNPTSGILVVEYSLPSPDDVPRTKEVRYNQTSDDHIEVPLSESEFAKLYDSIVYQMTLRSIHELFVADVAHALEAIVFNGWVESIDKATGKQVNACILSVQARYQEFESINLKSVEPKSCFKALKGVGSSKLHSLAAIAPILQISRKDKRFIASREVADALDETYNLATMDWEDFEQFIREVFEKEFARDGGEVKVTQASRDGGVDAVAFDPDPIRGGKIVIQAKRYTNTVGVSAVRDLYGTVLNEGATKGILVTTADYGPDAYEFAKGKPLTLLNGSNLLSLLEKHGRKARIDLKEAKRVLGEREKMDTA